MNNLKFDIVKHELPIRRIILILGVVFILASIVYSQVISYEKDVKGSLIDVKALIVDSQSEYNWFHGKSSSNQYKYTITVSYVVDSEIYTATLKETGRNNDSEYKIGKTVWLCVKADNPQKIIDYTGKKVGLFISGIVLICLSIFGKMWRYRLFSK